MGVLALVATFVVSLIVSVATVSADDAPDDPILLNGLVEMGVNPHGELIAPDVSAGGYSQIGLGFDRSDAITPGCDCEGWGAGDAISGNAGWIGQDVGKRGVKLGHYATDWKTGTAVSRTILPRAGLRVIQHFSPKTDYFFVNKVRVVNASEAVVDARFRRTVDWDVPPTEFSEMVTIDAGNAEQVLFTSDDGFAKPNPLAGPSEINFSGNAEDNGPEDHGALFDFDMGELAPGESSTIKLYWGAAPDESTAKSALGAIAAEAYSLGQAQHAPNGGPQTFMFAATEIGGDPLCDEETGTCAPIEVGAMGLGSALSTFVNGLRSGTRDEGPNPNEVDLRAESRDGDAPKREASPDRGGDR